MSSGRVEIGAFRTWPPVCKHFVFVFLMAQDYKVPENLKMKPPKGKGEHDFGMHAEKYYKLDITIFKSALDSFLLEKLWSKYWVQTLAMSRNLFVRLFEKVLF